MYEHRFKHLVQGTQKPSSSTKKLKKKKRLIRPKSNFFELYFNYNYPSFFRNGGWVGIFSFR